MSTAKEKADSAWREVKQRTRVYERLVDQGRMTRQFADREIRIMEEIAKDYDKLAEAERLI